MTIELKFGNETINANAVKAMVIQRLLEDKIISKDQATEYNYTWQVIIIKPEWFKGWLKFFKKENLTEYIYKYVKFEK